MLPQNKPDRIRIPTTIAWWPMPAGLLPATLARHLGLRELVDHHLDLGGAPGRANTGDKMLTLVASALAGGDCIDDADALRAGGTVGVLGCVKAPSTLGTFLRSFRWGHVRQLDRVSRQFGPGLGRWGRTRRLAPDHRWTRPSARPMDWPRRSAPPRLYRRGGYHPLLATAAGTGDVLMSRLREGRANTARGAAHFLRETVSRVRRAGASGQLTARADSGFYAHALVAACREMDVRFSDGITIRQHKSLRNLIEAIPELAWTPVPYWNGRRRRCWRRPPTPPSGLSPAPHRCGSSSAAGEAHACRFPTGPLRHLQLSGFITDRDGETLELEADHRRHAEIENAIRDLKYGVGLNHMPSGGFAANGAWLAVQVMAHNLARWTARIGLGEQIATTKTLRRRFFSLAGRHPLGTPPHPASATALALGNPVQSRPGTAASDSTPSLTAPVRN